MDLMTIAKTNAPVGTILVGEWGYDCTIYEFFKVLGYTAKSVKLAKLGKVNYHSPNDFKGERLTVDYTDEIVEQKTLRVQEDCVCKFNYCYLHLDGHSNYDKSRHYTGTLD